MAYTNGCCLQESCHINSNSTSDVGDKPSKSLSEAAREYEEARAVKRKYEEVTIVTGEEDEANVLQVNVTKHYRLVVQIITSCLLKLKM
jgi:hypothetical protein